MKTTLHNSASIFEPQFKPTNHRSSTGKSIYLKTSYDGTQTFVVKGRQLALSNVPTSQELKLSFMPNYVNLDPKEHKQLFQEHPERFAAYRDLQMRNQILQYGGVGNHVSVHA